MNDPQQRAIVMYRFQVVTGMDAPIQLGTIDAASWLQAVCEAGQRWPGVNFKVHSGVEIQ